MATLKSRKSTAPIMAPMALVVPEPAAAVKPVKPVKGSKGSKPTASDAVITGKPAMIPVIKPLPVADLAVQASSMMKNAGFLVAGMVPLIQSAQHHGILGKGIAGTLKAGRKAFSECGAFGEALKTWDNLPKVGKKSFTNAWDYALKTLGLKVKREGNGISPKMVLGLLAKITFDSFEDATDLEAFTTALIEKIKDLTN